MQPRIQARIGGDRADVGGVRPAFLDDFPALQIPMGADTGLVTPWRPPGQMRAGGWVVSFARPQFPFTLMLARNDDQAYGRRCVFNSLELAVIATLLHGWDGTRSDLKIGDGLYWAAGAPVPCQPL